MATERDPCLKKKKKRKTIKIQKPVNMTITSGNESNRRNSQIIMYGEISRRLICSGDRVERMERCSSGEII